MPESLCAVITGPAREDIERLIKQAAKLADIVEWRLDTFDEEALGQLEAFRTLCRLPVIFTLRSKRQGGQFEGGEEERLKQLEELLTWLPDFVDLESDLPLEFVHRLRQRFPQIKMIVSFHDFRASPANLEAIYAGMQHLSADYYKIALMANSSLDGMHLLAFMRCHPENLIAISMGESGQFTRILGSIFGNKLTYACLEASQEVAPGQIMIKDLIDNYYYRLLTPETKILGLIGHPVDKSLGHLVHNAALHMLGVDAVYVKIPLKEEDLSAFIAQAKALSFVGLSVTMPLKEVILKHLDSIDSEAEKIGAVNTLKLTQGKIIGYNTDGIGALKAIEKQLLVKGQTMLVLGAGGAAKAIIYEALKRGAKVIVLNRHYARARALGKRFGCRIARWEDINALCREGYDILVNATPASLPIPVECILPQTVVMDIKTHPFFSELLSAAQSRQCRIIPGYFMFVEQAVHQVLIWFGDQLDAKSIEQRMLAKVTSHGLPKILGNG